MARLAFRERQGAIATGVSARQAQHDVAFLLSFLAHSRGHTYELLPQDYADDEAASLLLIAEEQPTGRRIGIEWCELTKADFKRAQSHLAGSGEKAKVGLHKLNGLEIASLLTRAIAARIEEGALVSADVDERVLLLRNRIANTSESTFLRAPSEMRQKGIEQAFLIVQGRLFECW